MFKLKRKTLILLSICLSGFIAFGLYHAHLETHPSEYQIQNFDTVLEQPDGITCGPTSCAMVLKYYGKEVTIDEVKKQTKTHWWTLGKTPIGMTEPSMIKSAMGHFGVPAQMRWGRSLHVLKHFVAQDKPVIVLVRSGDTTWHYVVVTGFDKEEFTIVDPGPGKTYKMKKDVLDKCWNFTHDMDGDECDNDLLKNLLFNLDVYPRSMIIPKEAKK